MGRAGVGRQRMPFSYHVAGARPNADALAFWAAPCGQPVSRAPPPPRLPASRPAACLGSQFFRPEAKPCTTQFGHLQLEVSTLDVARVKLIAQTFAHGAMSELQRL